MTPEEQLLRLIESGDKGTRKSVLWDVRTWAARFFPYKEKAKRLARVRLAAGLVPRELSLKLVNRGLIVLLVLSGAGVALNMNRVQPSLQDLSSQLAASRTPAGEEQALASLRPLEEYLAEVQKRDLFSLSAPPSPKPEKLQPKVEPVKPAEPAQPPKPTPLEILRDKAKALKLVGISWGETPLAMIEDTAKGETSFLKAGQFINEMRIKAILKDRVVLSYGNAEYDLF